MRFHTTKTNTRKRRHSFRQNGPGFGDNSLKGTFISYVSDSGEVRRAVAAKNKQATKKGYVK